MNALPYYKAYPRDFIEGTAGMSFEVKCAYRVIIDLIYLQNGRLPDDARYIAGQLGCSVRKWKSIREALIDADKIDIAEGVISNFRADFELETTRKFQDKQRENATGPRKNNELQKPRQSHTEPEPEPDNKLPPERISDSVPAGAGSPSNDRYAFEASTIKLTGHDLERWRRDFPHVSLPAELWALDEWAGQQRNWFVAVSAALAKKERQATERINMARLDREAGPSRRAVPDPRI